MRTRIVVVTSAFVLLLSMALAAPAAADHLRYAHLYNWNSSQCLAIGGGSMSYGAPAIQWPCNFNPGLEQTWLVELASQAWPYSPTQVVNVNSGQCLAVGGGATWPGAGVIQWPCRPGAEEQLWYFHKEGTYISQFRNLKSRLCLAIGGASMNPGTKALQWTCSGGREQQWSYH